jgi:hypothetical protein
VNIATLYYFKDFLLKLAVFAIAFIWECDYYPMINHALEDV